MLAAHTHTLLCSGCRMEEALLRAEAALGDDWLSSGDRLALQRRILRLGGCGCIFVGGDAMTACA